MRPEETPSIMRSDINVQFAYKRVLLPFADLRMVLKCSHLEVRTAH